LRPGRLDLLHPARDQRGIRAGFQGSPVPGELPVRLGDLPPGCRDGRVLGRPGGLRADERAERLLDVLGFEQADEPLIQPGDDLVLPDVHVARIAEAHTYPVIKEQALLRGVSGEVSGAGQAK
jgi:hypothetical protein